jgi:hypothetical protein
MAPKWSYRNAEYWVDRRPIPRRTSRAHWVRKLRRIKTAQSVGRRPAEAQDAQWARLLTGGRSRNP